MALAWLKTDNPAIQNIGFGSASATFTNAAIGTASADRIVVVCVSSKVGIDGPTVACTIGGNAATKALQNTLANGYIQSIHYLLVTSGTTATVVVTYSGGASPAISFAGITVGKLTGAVAAPTTTASRNYGYNADAQTTTTALTVPAGGVGVVVGGSETPNGSLTWNVGTQDYSTISGTDTQITSGYITASGSQTPNISGFNFTGFGIAAATWDVAAATRAVGVGIRESILLSRPSLVT